VYLVWHPTPGDDLQGQPPFVEGHPAVSPDVLHPDQHPVRYQQRGRLRQDLHTHSQRHHRQRHQSVIEHGDPATQGVVLKEDVLLFHVDLAQHHQFLARGQ